MTAAGRGGAGRPRLLVIVGTRPDAIKLAPVVAALRRHADELETIVCSTGQHRDLLDRALAGFGLAPAIDLALMRPRQSLADLTSRAVAALDGVIDDVRPDLVIVQGDTTSALAGALAAHYRRVPVAHVEAGLRTDDLVEPFPEEANRRLIGVLAGLHFAPTPEAARRLLREHVEAERIFVTGNTAVDALLEARRARPARSASPAGSTQRLILVTVHRRESHGAPLAEICRAIRSLVERNPAVEVVFSVHPSPAVREIVMPLLGGSERIRLVEPLDYGDFIPLLEASYLVLTDSGGIQEEAPSLRTPVLVLRNRTERPEGPRAGTACVVGTSADRIVEAVEGLLHDDQAYRSMAGVANPYGDGRASERIVAALRHHFGLSERRPAPFEPPSLDTETPFVSPELPSAVASTQPG